MNAARFCLGSLKLLFSALVSLDVRLSVSQITICALRFLPHNRCFDVEHPWRVSWQCTICLPRISHRISRTCMHHLHIHRPQLGHTVTRVLLQQMDTSSMVSHPISSLVQSDSEYLGTDLLISRCSTTMYIATQLLLLVVFTQSKFSRHRPASESCLRLPSPLTDMEQRQLVVILMEA